MTSTSKAINKLLKSNKNGFVFSTYSKAYVSNSRPDFVECHGAYYEVSSGKVTRWEYNAIEREWLAEDLVA